MPTFSVLRSVDAYIHYIAPVQAENAEEAAYLANEDEARYEWKRQTVEEFDARVFVSLKEDGTPIESTQRGDF